MDSEGKTSILNVQAINAARGAEPQSACFIVLTGSQAGKMYKLEGDELIIGRSMDAKIRIEDDGVSRRHAKIVKSSDGTVAIIDAGSTNGTFCNGQKVEQWQLSDGDKIQIGTATILKFSFQDSIEEDFQRRQYESATRDALTGCYNKKYFLERLPSEFAFAVRHKKPLSLAMFDIDHFKKINDIHGHQAGDHVLKMLAHTVKEAIRSGDVLARYGGEEFALIMRETLLDAAFIAVERIRRRVESMRFEFADQIIKVTLSAGVSVYESGTEGSVGGLIRAADEFLYKAKNAGRNRTECALL